MTDIHTHILPGMDDGSKNEEMSLAMLKMQKEQGVDRVVLTPHCYRDKETLDSFLKRRAEAYERLQRALDGRTEELPSLVLGAEVAMSPHLADCPELHELCFAGTDYMLLEMPFVTWNDQVIRDVYEIMSKRGITPVFAHLERYIKDQRPEYIEEILSMGTPIQVSSAPMLGFWERRPVVKLLRAHEAHIMASDAHNLTTRQPNLGPGLAAVRKVLGEREALRLIRHADQLFES